MILNKETIKNKLKTKLIGKDFHLFDSVTSTFDASDTLPVSNGTVVCAKEQTCGRGRLGRDWVSQIGGIYFSLILSPQKYAENLQIYTAICAIAVQRAISEYVPCFIKWPNDIVSQNGKKLCGILTKSKFCEGKTPYINVGIGINANNSVSSSALPYASSVKECANREIDENALLCDVLFEIEKCIEFGDAKKITDEFSKVCITVGRMVKILSPDGESIRGKCISIDADGSAIIEKDDKSLMKVNSGEVSVRGIYGEDYV